MYADIIVDITHEKVDKKFEYKIPSHLADKITIGSKVLIPFGRGNKEITGYVVGFLKEPSFDKKLIKEIHNLAPGSIAIEEKLITLASWIKEEYGGTMAGALKVVLPIKKREKTKEAFYVRLAVPREEAIKKLEHLLLYKNQKARVRALAALIDHPVLAKEELKNKFKVEMKVIEALVKQGLVMVETKRIYRNPTWEMEEKKEEVSLNQEQEKILSSFKENFSKGNLKPCLIKGVTGSGKTEVYIKMAQEVVKSGRQVIIMIPEIALTFQTVARFMGAFKKRVAIINSKLSYGERYDQIEMVREGKIDVMIGPRSAVFTPFNNLGLIVIDEEHEGTYKSEQMPRYHGREVAIKRAELENAIVVMGSATPSLASYYHCEKGDYQLYELTTRATKNLLPTVEIVDMKAELKSGNRSFLSSRLQELIEDRLQKKQQVMLFLNRRGFSGFVSCRACGYVMKCPHCDVSLSIHKGGKMVCHYCGYETKEVKSCPECGSPFIGGFKAGTQQVEDYLKKRFKEAKTLRMDLDTTREKEGYQKILKAFDNHEADILIGTQMIVKGHDFKDVTLVGIIAADMSLYSNDYQAGERTFQLITQAAGRAGRGSVPGQAVIQTYSPDNYAIIKAKEQDYEGFYQEEMAFRDLMEYPPVYSLVAVIATGKEEEELDLAMDYLKKFCDLLEKKVEVRIIGPATPYIKKIKDLYKKVIYIKSIDNRNLIYMKDKIEEYIDLNKGFNNLSIQFDFDPMNNI
ncbi:MAG TPA: primosomal protein N' [Candidatus Dorea intestinavium]|nr:primosomal protein N' [Candidatus Dorea intestinavium]